MSNSSSQRPSPDPATIAGFFADAQQAIGLDVDAHYEAFCFGATPAEADEFGAIVVDGPKRATTGLVAELVFDGEQVPLVDSLWVVHDGAGQPLALICTRHVQRLPFEQVGADFAWDEGEGDRGLTSWRRGHVNHFERSCARIGVAWTPTLEVILERFEVLWPRFAAGRRILRGPFTHSEWHAYHELRRIALFERYLPGIRYEPDFAENFQPSVTHLGLFEGTTVLGCVQVCRRTPHDASIHLVATVDAARGRGLGRELVGGAEAFARVNGVHRVHVTAERQAAGFYARIGYVADATPVHVPLAADTVPLVKSLRQGMPAVVK